MPGASSRRPVPCRAEGPRAALAAAPGAVLPPGQPQPLRAVRAGQRRSSRALPRPRRGERGRRPAEGREGVVPGASPLLAASCHSPANSRAGCDPAPSPPRSGSGLWQGCCQGPWPMASGSASRGCLWASGAVRTRLIAVPSCAHGLHPLSSGQNSCMEG